MATPPVRSLLVALASALAGISGCHSTAPPVTCPTGQTACDGICFDLQANPANCGACGTRCPTGATCTGGACRCPAGETSCGAAPGVCADLSTDPRHCGTCTTSCGASQTCTEGTCCDGGMRVCRSSGGLTCCAGTGCCANGCQPAHANGLGQAYYDCSALGTHTRETALLAAQAWSPTGGTDASYVYGGDCLGRTTATACATWCYTGTFAGRVSLNTISVTCLPPTTLDPAWE